MKRHNDGKRSKGIGEGAPPTVHRTLQGGFMNTKKKMGLAAGVLGLMVRGMGWVQESQAASTDTITVSVTPGGVSYAVSITSVSAGTGYAFGTVNLGATTVSTAAIVVTNTGNIAEYFALAISNSGPDSWTPSSATSTNTFVMDGYFNTTQPAPATPTDTLGNGVVSASANLYNQANAKTGVSSTKNLWLKLIMPTQLNGGTGGQQTMTLSVTGQST